MGSDSEKITGPSPIVRPATAQVKSNKMYLDDLDEDEYEIAIKVSDAADATTDGRGRKEGRQQCSNSFAPNLA